VKNTVLVLGLLLVVANAIASGEAAQLWSTVKGSAGTPLPGTAGSVNGITRDPNGNITIPNQTLPGVGDTTVTPGGAVKVGPLTLGPF
jgi:hypothetical protein